MVEFTSNILTKMLQIYVCILFAEHNLNECEENTLLPDGHERAVDWPSCKRQENLN